MKNRKPRGDWTLPARALEALPHTANNEQPRRNDSTPVSAHREFAISIAADAQANTVLACILNEDLVSRVLVNPNAATLEENRELLTPVHDAPRLVSVVHGVSLG
ncbi:MAG TPA: hypothetical protein VI981_00155 [Candidatus Paceibacterota bacterium]